MSRNASLLGGLLVLVCVNAVADETQKTQFFETKIRPILVQHCYQCHSAESEEVGGGLFLDSSSGIKSGGDSGPAVKPGDAANSILISAIKYESTEMPPEGQLPKQVIRDFEKWINDGATDPRSGTVAKPHRHKIDIEAGREFWAFRPLAPFTPPAGTSDSENWIDAYLNKQLLTANILANPSASPETLLRRLSYDLTGLPPNPDQIADWLADPSPRNWSILVDTMLASPEFAQHWARHWMDVARYADSNGSDFNATFHEAWRYRQYLIDSFAIDRPFDHMIRQQVAGDLLPAESDSERESNVVATTFLMLGTKMLSERNKAKLELDVVDEQIDTVGRAFLGMTLGCARCHDHKFDPIPTEDYYALAGIFKSTRTLNGESQKYVSTWNRVKLPVSDKLANQQKAYQTTLAELEGELRSTEKRIKTLQAGQITPRGIVIDDSEAKKTGTWKASTLFPHYVGDGYVHDDRSNKGSASIQFQAKLPNDGVYEVRIAYSPGSNRAQKVPIEVIANGETHRNTLDQRTIAIEPMWASIGKFQFTADEPAVVTISNQGTTGYVIADAVQFLSSTDERNEHETAKVKLARQELERANTSLTDLRQRIATLKKNRPPAPPEAMAPSDRTATQISDSPVHIRGELTNLGPVIPRGFIQVCSVGNATIQSPQGSGRLELARWLTDNKNPLVKRVIVNRVWMHLMGEGIVRTVDNFGAQGDRPSHPELLDALASQFSSSGWHLKPLIRKIVMSQAYQRSSQHSEEAVRLDPENRRCWRMNRKRIPAESIRDTILRVANQLDTRIRVEPMKGKGTLVSKNDASSSAKFDAIVGPSKSIFVPTVRGYMPPLLTLLDVANPDLLVGRRPITNVPAQALVLINSSEVHSWAAQAARRILAADTAYQTRLRNVYLLCLQRTPLARDLRLADSFFAGREDSTDAWREYIAAIFASTEFRFLD